jgi:hypothetical protein
LSEVDYFVFYPKEVYSYVVTKVIPTQTADTSGSSDCYINVLKVKGRKQTRNETIITKVKVKVTLYEALRAHEGE